MSLPPASEKTIDDWRFYVAVTCDYFHGCSIEKSYFEKLNMTPGDLIAETDYEYCEATLGIGFRMKHKKTDLQFGDEASQDRKSKRVDAAYVWSSLL